MCNQRIKRAVKLRTGRPFICVTAGDRDGGAGRWVAKTSLNAITGLQTPKPPGVRVSRACPGVSVNVSLEHSTGKGGSSQILHSTSPCLRCKDGDGTAGARALTCNPGTITTRAARTVGGTLPRSSCPAGEPRAGRGRAPPTGTELPPRENLSTPAGRPLYVTKVTVCSHTNPGVPVSVKYTRQFIVILWGGSVKSPGALNLQTLNVCSWGRRG